MSQINSTFNMIILLHIIAEFQQIQNKWWHIWLIEHEKHHIRAMLYLNLFVKVGFTVIGH